MSLADVRAEVVADAAGTVVVELRWREDGRAENFEMFEVLRFRDGKVVDMEDFDRRGAALRAAGVKV